jgi:hypothetical protein
VWKVAVWVAVLVVKSHSQPSGHALPLWPFRLDVVSSNRLLNSDFLVESHRKFALQDKNALAHPTPILTIQDAIKKESWVLPPVEFSHGEVEQAFQNAAHF